MKTWLLALAIAGSALFGPVVCAHAAVCAGDPEYTAQLMRQDSEQLQDLQRRHGVNHVSMRLQRVFDRLRTTAGAQAAGQRWRLAGYAAPAINAYAAHDGTIVVSAGLDNRSLPEQVIAAGLAHEIAHVLLHHGLERACLALQLMTPALAAGSTTGAAATAQDNSRRVNNLMQAQELQADALAIELLHAAGYPPHALSELLARLAPQAQRSADTSGSHPSHALRLGQAIRAETAVQVGARR